MCTIDPRTLLDPQCRQLGTTLLEAGLRAADPMTMTLDQARQAAELWHAAQASGAPAMAETRNLTIAGPH
ncbi:MAG: hypothetical protein K2Q10_10620, partial [Rhodospirillales bacterium]|nr:hypothetical protein [Rhodospirillales bacterium]